MKQNLLFILDMDSTLLTDDVLGNKKLGPYDDVSVIYSVPIGIYKRPFMDEFLDFLFNNFTGVALWTAADKEWMNVNLNGVLKKYKNKFLFTWDRSKVNYKLFPPFVAKPLDKVWKEYPQYNITNTIIIDDTKNITGKYDQNQILIPKFLPNKNNRFDVLFLEMKHKITSKLLARA